MTKKLKVVLSISAGMAVLCCLIAILCVMLAQPAPVSLSVAIDEISLRVDDVVPLTYKCSDESAEVSFSVEDENIVKIEGENIRAKQVGSTTLRVTATRENDRAVATAKIYVTENPTGPITNLPNKLTIYLLDKNINEARQAGFDNEYTFVSHKDYTLSSNGNSAKITKNTITANKEGLTIFTFTNGDQKQTVEVEVLSIQPTLTLPESISLSLNEKYGLAYILTPSYYTGAVEITLKENGTNLTITDLSVTAKQPGTTTLFVYLNDTLQKEIPVSVAYDEEVKLILLSPAKVDGDTIYTSSDIFIFQTNIDSSEPIISATGGEVHKELDTIILTNFTSARVVISYPDLNKTLAFYVVRE